MGIKHLQGVFCQEVILGKEKRLNEREAGIVQKEDCKFFCSSSLVLEKPLTPSLGEKKLNKGVQVGDWVEITEGFYSGRHGELVFKRLALQGRGMQYAVRLEERIFRGRHLQRVIQKLVMTKNIRLLKHRGLSGKA